MKSFIVVMQVRLGSKRLSNKALMTIQDSKKRNFPKCIFKISCMSDNFLTQVSESTVIGRHDK